ncbi:MAG: glycosyltransferase [Planktomarina sp.]
MRLVFETKFSFLGKLSWRSEASRTPDLLYNPDRLERRFQLFEQVMLPSIADQTDDDFELLIMTASTLPDAAKERLNDVVEQAIGADRAKILEFGPRRSWRLMWNYISEHYANEQQMVQVNLDDDDGLCVDYVEICKAEAARAMQSDFYGVPYRYLSFAQGYDLGYIDGQISEVAPAYRPLKAPGAAVVGPPDVEVSPMVQVRTDRGVSNSTIINTDRPFYIKSLHDFNDKETTFQGAEDSLDDTSEVEVYFPSLIGQLPI